MRNVVTRAGLLVPGETPVWAPSTQDQRSNEDNTEAVAGAPWVHFHHRTSDMSATSPSRPRPLCVELVCHACHQSAIVYFKVDLVTKQTHRGEEVGRVGHEFCQQHKSCSWDRGVDYERTCDARRNGEPLVFDFTDGLVPAR